MSAPKRVVAALTLMTVALLLGVAILVWAWRQPAIAVACLLIIGGLIGLAARRRNWARVTLVLVTVLSLIVNWALGFLPFQLQYGGVIAVATGAQIVLEIAACALLFHQTARDWYR
jgi:uncharacterized membrane protein (UPF0136 family)